MDSSDNTSVQSSISAQMKGLIFRREMEIHEAAHNLAEQYGGWWREHPDFPLEDWQYEVSNGDTRRGYWHWVAAQLSDGEE